LNTADLADVGYPRGGVAVDHNQVGLLAGGNGADAAVERQEFRSIEGGNPDRLPAA
jgi:hypothetical protein